MHDSLLLKLMKTTDKDKRFPTALLRHARIPVLNAFLSPVFTSPSLFFDSAPYTVSLVRCLINLDNKFVMLNLRQGILVPNDGSLQVASDTHSVAFLLLEHVNRKPSHLSRSTLMHTVDQKKKKK